LKLIFEAAIFRVHKGYAQKKGGEVAFIELLVPSKKLTKEG
jgi:hypothetical protein